MNGDLAVIATPFEGADVVTAVALLHLGDLVGDYKLESLCTLSMSLMSLMAPRAEYIRALLSNNITSATESFLPKRAFTLVTLK